MKQVSFKLTAVLVLITALLPALLSGTTYSYIETVNARKHFFYNVKDWDTFFKKSVHTEYADSNTGLFCSIKNGYYVLVFLPVKESLKSPGAYGKIRYIFNREKELVEVDVWYLENNGSYLKFKRDKTFDIYLFSEIYKQGLNYHFSFESLKYLSHNSILSVLRDNRLDNQLLITREDYEQKEKFVNTVIMPSLVPGNYVEDGARNEFGDFVHIADGTLQEGKKGFNCSGYVKEVIDNYLRFMKPGFKFLSINELKKRRLNERKKTSFAKYETLYDPYFGSDWVRNLVDAVNTNLDYSIIRAEELKNDQYSQYYQTYGYNIDQLQHILFRDQMIDSSYFYLIVFNRLKQKSPVIPEFYHVAVIVPYFKDRHFYLYVFESGFQSGYAQLIKNQLTKSIDREIFQNNILPNVPSVKDREFLKKMYSRNDYRNVILKKNINLEEAVHIFRILNRIEYKTKKTLIFKVPIKNFL